MEEDRLVRYGRSVRRVLLLTLGLNAAVALAKMLWGYVSGSVGMFSDGIHSLVDGTSNVIGLVGIRLASRPPDPTHPYGHRKFETVFTAIISGMIFLAAAGVLRRAFTDLTGEHHPEVGLVSFGVMGLTLLVNITVMRYELRRGRELGSEYLRADAMHTKSDIFASLGVVAGLILTRMGYPWADAVAGAVVALFIARIGVDILRRAARVLVDTVQMDTAKICQVVYSVKGVRDCHNIRTRGMERHVHLDLHIQLDADISLEEAHAITHQVEDRLRESFPEVADIVVHTEPTDNMPRGPIPS
ncbi:MAG: cation diffusion facilitator family transporter [Nitrospirota bacterium]|jgi:cation diffusion facilitator family transporter